MCLVCCVYKEYWFLLRSCQAFALDDILLKQSRVAAPLIRLR